MGKIQISLGRLGANVTGVDFSEKAIEKAKELASTSEVNADFICCNIYNLPKNLNKKFDIIFTSYGVIGWLPNLNKWAGIISHFSKPAGKFALVEFHPFLWIYNNDFTKIKYRYFNSGPIIEAESGTYAEKNAPINFETVEWNHSFGEVINSLIKNNFEISALEEFDYSPYNCFDNMIEYAPKKFRIEHLGNKIPMIYSIAASKKPNP